MAMAPKIDASTPALILKTNATKLHHGALGVARTLGRLGVSVYATDADHLTPLAFSRHVKRAFAGRGWTVTLDGFAGTLRRIAERIEKPAVLFPMDDLSAVLVAEHAVQIEPAFIIPPVPPEVPRMLANKISLNSVCAKLEIPYPNTAIPTTVLTAQDFARRAAFPLVAKAADQWALLQGRFNAKIVHSLDELMWLCGSASRDQPPPMILQEYIHGEDWITHGYYNPQRGVYRTYTGRKLHAYPSDAGSTAVGISIDNPKLREQSERLLRAVGFAGIIDMDWRRDQRDGEYRLLDCNPRIGMNFRMFETEAAIDVARAQYLDLTGQALPNSPATNGRQFTVKSYYALSRLRSLGRGPGSEWPDATCREFAWWHRDDPLPVAAMWGRLMGRTFRSAARLTRQRARGH